MKWFVFSILTLLVACSQLQETGELSRVEKLCHEGQAKACWKIAHREGQHNRQLSFYYYRKACLLGHEKSCDRALVMSFRRSNTHKYALDHEKTCRERGDYHCSVAGRHFFRVGQQDRAVRAWEKGCQRGDFNSCVQLSQWAWKEGLKEKARGAVNRACSAPSEENLAQKEFLERHEEKLKSCLLSGLWYFENGEKELAVSYYSRTCQMATFKGQTPKEGFSLSPKARLYQMLGCSRAGVFRPIKRKKWLELGREFLKSRCTRGTHEKQYQDCYDLAALESLAKKTGLASRYLRLAIDKGFQNWDHLIDDPEMAHLRQSPEFVQLMKNVKGKLLRDSKGQIGGSGQ